MSASLPDFAKSLDFKEFLEVRERTSIADLFKPGKRCGIYILHFSTGEVYAGQAVDVTRRYVQHRKNHDDIVQISFKEVRQNNLDEEEWNVIDALERNGFMLRNISLTSVVQGETDFDLVMSPVEQERWLADQAWFDLEGVRTNDENLRRKYGRRFQVFQKDPHADEVISILRTYIRKCVPVPVRSELSFWSVSCLPSSGSFGIKVYCRVNINWQEVLTIWSWNNNLYFSWHLARSPLGHSLGSTMLRVWRKHHGLRKRNHFYVPGGRDQIALAIKGSNKAEAVLSDDDLIHAMRTFNLRLMRKGPCVYSKYHCFDLADRLLEASSGV